MPDQVKTDTLETDRLILRRPVDGDLDAIATLLGDPDVMRTYGTGQPFDRATSREWLDKIEEHYRAYGYGAAVISLRTTGETIGLGGISRGSMSDEVLFGCVLARRAWRQGYAFELGTATLDYGFSRVGLERIEAITPASNGTAIALATKLQMRLRDRFVHDGIDYVLFAKTNETSKGSTQS